MATEKLSNGQGVVVSTDTDKPTNAQLKAQGWSTTNDTAENPISGHAV